MKVNTLFKSDEFVGIDDYLKVLGISSPSKYFKYNTVEDDNNYDNLDVAIALFKKHRDRESKIATLVDS
jgi:hypothetical protein